MFNRTSFDQRAFSSVSWLFDQVTQLVRLIGRRLRISQRTPTPALEIRTSAVTMSRTEAANTLDIKKP